MPELHRALAEINAIRGQIARVTEFQGYGPASVAGSGILALSVALVQSHWLKGSAPGIRAFLLVWIAVAAVSVLLTGIEMVKRARRVHVGLANAMMQRAVEQFVPAIMAGALLSGVLIRFAPQSLWMLPGLWQLIFSLGVFASCRFLPRPMFIVGVWYLSCGLIGLAVGGAEGACSPWSMGIPFGIGQLLVAAVLKFGSVGKDGR
ncbi:MAG: hypothetical protein ACLQJ0_10910 [Steroidobacteraceae bacterium]|jgi:hypothetical protein